MKLITRLCLAIGMALTLTMARATPDAKALAPLLSELRNADLVRGSWAIQRGDEAPLSGQIGPATADGRPSNGQTSYRIGSISKLVTAVLVLQLIEQGRLQLGQPVAPLFGNPPALANVTVEHLLQHRSGLGDVKNLPDFDTWARSPRSLDELLERVLRLPREFAPGSRARYSNSGYLVLHALLERVGGAPYARQLRQRIAEPLAITSLVMVQPDQESSQSFEWDGEAWQPSLASHPSVPQGAGGLVATPADLTRFIRALFTNRLLKAETLSAMVAQKEGFGLGVYALPRSGELALQGFGHEGQIDGYHAVLMYLPGQQLAAAVLLNGQRWPRDAMLQELMRWATSDSYQALDVRPKRMSWKLRLHPAGAALPPGSHFAVRGSQAPLSWKRGLRLHPLADGRFGVDLNWEGRAGMPLEAKFVIEDRDGKVIRWERTGNRHWFVDQEPDVLKFDTDAELEALQAAVADADAKLSAAINQRDLPAITALLSPNLEFFHDKGGLSDFATNVEQFRHNFARASGRSTRTLLPDGLQVYPVPGIGAMQIGRHRFCFVPDDAAPQCQDLGFSHVWERDGQGALRLLRVLSYGH